MRRLILIRHGQYDETGAAGELTKLGEKQAETTARMLFDIDAAVIHSSTMPRAEQTARIIARVVRAPVRMSALLCEAMPTRPPPRILAVDPQRVREDRIRADRAFDKIFRPARLPRTELVVCHGNIIRYFTCRALGVEADAWMRMDTHHCGITEVIVAAEGRMRLVGYNDIFHLPASMRTMSLAAAKSLQVRA